MFVLVFFLTFHIPSDGILFLLSSSEYRNFTLDSVRYTTAHRFTHGMWRGINCRQCPCWSECTIECQTWQSSLCAHSLISYWRICTVSICLSVHAELLWTACRIFMKCSDVTHCLRFWRGMEWWQVRILAKTPAILTEIFHNYFEFLQKIYK